MLKNIRLCKVHVQKFQRRILSGCHHCSPVTRPKCSDRPLSSSPHLKWLPYSAYNQLRTHRERRVSTQAVLKGECEADRQITPKRGMVPWDLDSGSRISLTLNHSNTQAEDMSLLIHQSPTCCLVAAVQSVWQLWPLSVTSRADVHGGHRSAWAPKPKTSLGVAMEHVHLSYYPPFPEQMARHCLQATERMGKGTFPLFS